MNSHDFVLETATKELADRLPSLKKHDYSTIDQLMRKVAKKHRINHRALHDLFLKKYAETPIDWIKSKLDEKTYEDAPTHKPDIVKQEVDKFIAWAANKFNLKTHPKIILSTDTEEAQSEHHTGSHTESDNHVWVYVKNRNLVDILRTVCHELVHVRQGEMGMIKPGSSYPGSPIEVLADAIAGKYIKIYGEKHHHIFQ